VKERRKRGGLVITRFEALRTWQIPVNGVRSGLLLSEFLGGVPPERRDIASPRRV